MFYIKKILIIISMIFMFVNCSNNLGTGETDNSGIVDPDNPDPDKPDPDKPDPDKPDPDKPDPEIPDPGVCELEEDGPTIDDATLGNPDVEIPNIPTPGANDYEKFKNNIPETILGSNKPFIIPSTNHELEADNVILEEVKGKLELTITQTYPEKFLESVNVSQYTPTPVEVKSPTMAIVDGVVYAMEGVAGYTVEPFPIVITHYGIDLVDLDTTPPTRTAIAYRGRVKEAISLPTYISPAESKKEFLGYKWLINAPEDRDYLFLRFYNAVTGVLELTLRGYTHMEITANQLILTKNYDEDQSHLCQVEKFGYRLYFNYENFVSNNEIKGTAYIYWTTAPEGGDKMEIIEDISLYISENGNLSLGRYEKSCDDGVNFCGYEYNEFAYRGLPINFDK